MQIVVLGFKKFSYLVQAKGPVVVCFEMARVKLDCLRVIVNGRFKVALFAVCETSVVKEVRFGWLKDDCLRKAFNCLLVVSPSVQRNAFVVIGEGVLRLNTDRSGVVLNGEIKLAQLIVGEPSIKQCFEVRRHYRKRL